MRFAKSLTIALVLPAGLNAGEEESPGVTELLPPELEVRWIDPVTVEKSPTFAGGERLKFKLGWGIFTVARSTLETVPEYYGDSPALRIRLKTRTNGFADAFYRVCNTSTSWIAGDVSGSFEYAAQQDEGGRERDTRALFDPVELTARYINNRNGENRDPVDILPGTLDPLGIVFFLRSIQFDVGDTLVIPTSNGKEFFHTIVRVTEKVKRRFRFGEQEAYVLEPDIKDIGGVFKRSGDGTIRFFISTDGRKLPLRMESEVAVGKFWAELVEAGLPELTEESVAVPEVE
ncbi:MAG: DUF3108 domain-containing protein [Opitutales bacterium]|jgi:hypothetical protein